MRTTKVTSLTLQKETLRPLENSDLPAVAGGVRIWKPVGRADNTDPIYSWEDDTLG
jgi:hypothetical protein